MTDSRTTPSSGIGIGQKKCLAILDPDAEKFGTVSHHEGQWAIVVPLDKETEKRALALLGRDNCMVVYR